VNITLLRKELREARWKLVVGSGVLVATAVMIPLIYEMIKDLINLIPGGDMEKYQSLMPVNIFSNFSLYIWSQWNAKNLTQLGTIIAILVGMNLIAGEISNQTVSFLLTRPIARRTVFFTKALAGALIIMLSVAVSTFALIAIVQFTPHSLEAGSLIVATFITTAGLIVIFALTLFFSTIIDEPVKAAGLTVVVVILLSVLGMFRQTRTLSLFNHMHATQYFIGGVFPLWPLVVMALAVIVLLGAGAYIFEKKEI
jgi:ABC-2 type transport system permease protein